MSIKDIYEKNGFVGPLRILSADKTQEYLKKLHTVDLAVDLMNSDYRCKSNVLFDWVDEITRNPTLVEYVTELIGPNFMCWDTLFWIKKANTPKRVSDHQDGTYWNFNNKHKAVTAWFTFTDATIENGCIQYVQGSHLWNQRKHTDIKDETNLLMRGQTVINHETLTNKISMEVRAGEVLFHGPYIVHGSNANRTTNDRISMGMIFVSTECKPTLTIEPESGILISGIDTYNNMIQDPRPTGIWDNDVVSWKLAYDRQHANYYEMRNL